MPLIFFPRTSGRKNARVIKISTAAKIASCVITGDGNVKASLIDSSLGLGIKGEVSIPRDSSQAIFPSDPNCAWTAPMLKLDRSPRVWMLKLCKRTLSFQDRGSKSIENLFKKAAMSLGTLVAWPPLVDMAAM